MMVSPWVAPTRKSERGASLLPEYFTRGEIVMVHFLGIYDVVVSRCLPHEVGGEDVNGERV